MAMASTDFSNLVVANKYRLLNKIGSGAYGVIYRAVVVDTSSSGGVEEEVAVKLELKSAECPQLSKEFQHYENLTNGSGIPRVIWYVEEDFYRALVIELLGPSLNRMFKLCGGHFSLKTVLMIADQMIQRLELIHSRNVVHRDIKPSNILIGRNKNCKENRLYLIDYGMAKIFRDEESQEHMPKSKNTKVFCTPIFASINCHRRKELSRRDDMESLGYVLLYFLRGNLPWQGTGADSINEVFEIVGKQKKKVEVEMLCGGFPREFAIYIKYCRSLDFDEEPDYNYLRNLFRILFRRNKYEYDFQYDWTLLKKEKSASPVAGCSKSLPYAGVQQENNEEILEQEKLEAVDKPESGDGPLEQDTNAAIKEQKTMEQDANVAGADNTSELNLTAKVGKMSLNEK